jgi:hypothetical protein
VDAAAATQCPLGEDTSYRYLLHDRDSIFARSLDESIGRLGLAVLKSPPRSPMANAICERPPGDLPPLSSASLILSAQTTSGRVSFVRLLAFAIRSPARVAARAARPQGGSSG